MTIPQFNPFGLHVERQKILLALAAIELAISAAIATPGDVQVDDPRPLSIVVDQVAEGDPELARPTPDARETIWSAWLAQELGGEAEHILADGSRIDVLTDAVAWEVERPANWAQSIGQAAFYGAASNRQGGVILLVGADDKARELAFILRCLVACRECDLILVTVSVK